jgi:hypothetical protein
MIGLMMNQINPLNIKERKGHQEDRVGIGKYQNTIHYIIKA